MPFTRLHREHPFNGVFAVHALNIECNPHHPISTLRRGPRNKLERERKRKMNHGPCLIATIDNPHWHTDFLYFIFGVTITLCKDPLSVYNYALNRSCMKPFIPEEQKGAHPVAVLLDTFLHL